VLHEGAHATRKIQEKLGRYGAKREEEMGESGGCVGDDEAGGFDGGFWWGDDGRSE
jgi:sirohydrochlorin ferrochelatase